jgi:hypothetical protein
LTQKRGHAMVPSWTGRATIPAEMNAQKPPKKRPNQGKHCPDHGASIAEIAATLALSEGTVRNYLSEAFQKLGARNRVEAAHMAREKGWL